MANLNLNGNVSKNEETLQLAYSDLITFGKLFSPQDFLASATPDFHREVGKLLINKLRRELQATTFTVKPNEQNPIREIANLGRKEEKDALVGNVISFKLTSTALPMIGLVERALQRANTKKAPNGYRAWQNARRKGFDYRKTAREKFGDSVDDEDSQYKPDTKVISKMWQQLLWRD